MDEFKKLDDIYKLLSALSPEEIGCATFMLELKQNNRDWAEKIPFISWPSEFEVMHWPTCQALLRGHVRLRSAPWRKVSFYLDGYCRLGSVYDKNGQPAPYWEIYNISENMDKDEYDVPKRYLMNDVPQFLDGISEMLSGKTKE